jgi:hypothetical protein
MAVHQSGQFESATRSIYIDHKPILDPSWSGVQEANPAYNVASSSDVYPPAAGSSASQTVYTMTTPAGAAEHFAISFKITGRKESGGAFDLDFRVFDATTGNVVATGKLQNPSGSASHLIETIFVPTAGQHTLQFQFESSQLFSAVLLESYEISVQRYI